MRPGGQEVAEPQPMGVLLLILIWPLLGMALCYGIGDDEKGAAIAASSVASQLPSHSSNVHFVRDGAIVSLLAGLVYMSSY
jgi:hypothetical protein